MFGTSSCTGRNIAAKAIGSSTAILCMQQQTTDWSLITVISNSAWFIYIVHIKYLNAGKIKKNYLNNARVSTAGLLKNKLPDLLKDWSKDAATFDPSEKIKKELTNELHSSASELFKQYGGFNKYGAKEMFMYKKKKKHRTMIKVCSLFYL